MGTLARVIRFLDRGVWEIRLKDLPPLKASSVRWLRVVILSVQGFMRNGSVKTASVLTYYSLLNIVPLVAVLFAIAKGFGLRKIVVSYVVQMAERANLQADVTSQILAFSNSLLTHARGGVIAGVGVVLLLWTVLSILGKIEDSFNTVWEVKRPRTLVRRFTDYISILVVAPILFAVSTSATVLVSGRMKVIMDEIAILGAFSSIILFLLNLLPYISVWVLLMVLYVVMPNARVPVRSGVLAGIVAGTGFQIVQFVYIKFQIGVAGYSAIYGSFAALPLLLVWLQTSWMIVLFGSEMAHASNHYETFGLHPDYSRLSAFSRKLLMARVFHLLVRGFDRGERPRGAKEISRELEIPVRLVQTLLAELGAAGLVVEVAAERRVAAAFQPARSIENITLRDVLDASERHGEAPPPSGSEEEERISRYLETISNAAGSSAGNVKVKDI
ncbi:MAG: hypothetical protein A4E61_00476 [Syntrophorhabdus sp. PtaB.Bin184]|jgi:membrane protein|nr:MAG: hypothetical protein A4E61_00476 [Syntrophorhabdus sp. PtaB.Bin184]